MNTRHLIGALIFRLTVLVGFGIFVGIQRMWVLLAIVIALGALTTWQLLRAYRG